ncbi:tyrosine-protein kinase SRK3-like [Arapaima gigas]
MENCCRCCMPCLAPLWNCIWPKPLHPPAQEPAEIRTVAGDLRLPVPKRRPAQLYAALFDFEARSEEELTVKEGDKLSVIEKRGDYVLAKKLTGSLESGLVPASYVTLLQDEFANYKWYYGNINRQKAEKLLLAQQNKSGSFLVRISESNSDEYTLSVRNESKVLHFRIQRSSVGSYYVSDKIAFATLNELVTYYQKNYKSLGAPLVLPCTQQRELYDMEPWERPREEFVLHRKLGQGHFGEVWEAVWTTQRKRVAIKMLRQAYNNGEIFDLIMSGYRMPAPPDCPTYIYEIMQSCWQLDPDKRPSFAAMKDRLQDFVSQ